MKKYFVYAFYDLLRKEYFYVGKGLQSRLKEPRRNKAVNGRIKNLQSSGNNHIIDYFECESDDDAKSKEIFLIKSIGRKDKGLGPLLNFTDGGDGRSGGGYKQSLEHIQKRITPESIEKRANSNRGKRRDGSNISKALKGKPQKREYVEIRAAARRGSVQSPVSNQKRSVAMMKFKRCQKIRSIKAGLHLLSKFQLPLTTIFSWEIT